MWTIVSNPLVYGFYVSFQHSLRPVILSTFFTRVLFSRVDHFYVQLRADVVTRSSKIERIEEEKLIKFS